MFKTSNIYDTLKITSKLDLIEILPPSYNTTCYTQNPNGCQDIVCNDFYQPGPPCCPNRSIGALTVDGSGSFGKGIRIGDSNTALCGTIRFHDCEFQGFNGSDWVKLDCCSSDVDHGIDVNVLSGLCSGNDHVAITPDASLGISASISIGPNPSGNGFISAQAPTPGSSVGGDCRGVKAVDWQMSRISPTKVAAGDYSGVLSGDNNEARGVDSVISGGSQNYVGGDNSGILGGILNKIISGDSTNIGGGENNKIYNNFSNINGGNGNTIFGPNNNISGGENNLISSDTDHSGIMNGFNNQIGVSDQVFFSSIVGGVNNINNGKYSFVGGGDTNIIRDGSSWCNIEGGQSNVNQGNFNFIGGGFTNQINSNNYNVIAGGSTNNISNISYATVSGGLSNTILQNFGSILGGHGCIISSDAVSGGESYARVVGGQYNDEVSSTSWKFVNNASDAITVENRVFTIGGGLDGARRNLFTVDVNGDVHAQGAYYTGGADYCEYFEIEKGDVKYECGMVMELVGDKVRRASEGSEEEGIIGVVSTNPSIVGNANVIGGVKVGLIGQIPVKKGERVKKSWRKMREIDGEYDMYFVR